MQSDFLDAHDRHLTDADTLYAASRWANADHLYGLSTECGLKGLMLVFGMQFDTANDRPQEQQDRKHADGIWARYETYRGGHMSSSDYALPAVNPFSDWGIAQRYAHQSNFDEARAKAHQTGAKVVYELLQKAKVDGHL